MEARYNFDLLFKKTQILDYKNLEIFKKAALLYQIHVPNDLKEFPNQDIETFKEHSLKNSKGTYRLNDEDRISILKESIGKSYIPKYIEKFQVHSTYSNFLLRLATVFSSKRINVNILTNEEIFYGIILAEIFPEILNKDDLKRIYQNRQFYKQFERITKNFAGREKELARINNYVDWLPKSGIIEKLTATFRKTINWHEKPPLLIKGIGGIGKSTLIAEFILNQNKKSADGNLPFVYIDFDLPGFTLKEPLTILIEALRQINIQYPKHSELINGISNQISSLILSKSGDFNVNQSTHSSTRSYVYDTVENIIESNNLDFKTIGKKPILVVFDSFEEMQYRASTTELFSFYQFIKEISEKLPRVRPIFAGRSELNLGAENFKFEQLDLEEFDAASANSLLEKAGIENKKTRDFIFENFGGNPLMLTLATDLVKKEEGLDIHNNTKIKGKKWQYLISRILGHIHNDYVRKIAVPGMLVRSITPEVIMQVLAEPTKIGFIDDQMAEDIFQELQKEVALISKSSDGYEFSFRQDLRMTCESMIWENYPVESKKIRENAIAYYSNYNEIENFEQRKKHKAEYFFHVMKNQEIPEELDWATYDELRPYMENFIIELPAESRRFIDSLNRQESSAETIKSSNVNNEEWEQYNLGLLKDALNGEFGFLRSVFESLRAHSPRVNNGFSEFGKYEALLYQRLDKIPLSRNFIKKAMQTGTGSKNKKLEFEFQLIQIQNLEYEERYEEALKLGKLLQNPSPEVGIENRKKYEFLLFRIENRVGDSSINNFQEFIDSGTFIEDSGFRDTKWDFIFNEVHLDSIQFKTHSELNSQYRNLRKELKDLNTLEGYAKKHLDFFLKDITYTGHFNIVLRDVLFAQEIIDTNSMLNNSSILSV